MSKYVTIKDIAHELGLSKSTVSRALSGDAQNVKPETMRLICDTAERLGYHRNELAVNLRKQSSRNIGIIIPEIVTSFYMNFISHAQKFLHARGYQVLIAASNENADTEAANVALMEQCMVDGMIVSVCDSERNRQVYHRAIERGMPVVFFDRTMDLDDASQVRLDDFTMSLFMVEKLIRSGRKHIVHIPGPTRIRNGYERWRGYREALAKFHLPDDPNLVLPPALSAEEGNSVMSEFLKKGIPFDAVFGFTETALLGAKSALQRQNMRIPDDVSLCCVSGTTLCTLVHPTITAVEQPVEQMALEACRLLLEHMANPAKVPEDVVVRGEIVERESSAIRPVCP